MKRGLLLLGVAAFRRPLSSPSALPPSAATQGTEKTRARPHHSREKETATNRKEQEERMTQIDLSLALWKTGFAVTILAVGLIFGLSPLSLRKVSHHWRDRLLSIANCFAAGIFAATGFVHLLAEGAELIDEQEMVSGLSATTFSLLLCCLGFFLTFIIDKVLFLSDDGHFHLHHHHHHGHGDDEEPKGLADPKEAMTDSEISNAYGTFEDTAEKRKQHHHHHHHHEHEHDHHHDHHDHRDHDSSKEKRHKPTISNYVLVVVLSLHSVLAGLL